MNAFLREDLLPTSVVQATTAAVTILRHGPRQAVEVKLRNGERLSFVLAKPGPRLQHVTPVRSLAEPLSRYVADETAAREVESVTVLSPSPALADGLVLLDTPGTNVDNPRHVEVARWAIHEACDVAVVLIPAKLQLAHSYSRFLSTHLVDNLHRCIFLITMIDQIAPEERDSVLRTVQDRIKSLLGVERPTILPVSAAAVLARIAPDHYELSPKVGEAERQRLVEELEQAEEHIREALRQQRTLIVLERLAVLLDRLYHELAAGLAAMESRYEEEHRALADSRISDLAAFAKRSKADHRASLESHSTDLMVRARQKIGRAREDAGRKLAAALDQSTTDIALAAVMKTGAPAAMEEARAGLEKSLAGILKDLRQAAVGEAEAFEKEFLVLYRSLATLGGRKDIEKAALQPLRALQADRIGGDLQGLAALVDSNQKFSEGLMKSLALAGLITGAAVGGPFGAVVGGILGLVAGAAFSPSADKLRPTYRAHLDKVLEEVFSTAEAAVLADLDAHKREAIRQVEAVVDRYVERYAALVRQMVAEDEQKARDLADRRRKVKNDATELTRRQQELTAARDGLRKIREI
ncbi:MAG: dynamin family protein [Thermoanaerobaculia bacterium]